MAYAVFELKPEKMRSQMETFVNRRPLYQTLALRRALEVGDDFNGWWFGATEAGEIEALMSIEGTSAHLHAANGDAAEALAKTLLSNQRHNRSAESHRHEILGDERSMARFYPTFRQIERNVVADQAWFLMGGGGDDGPLDNVSKRMKLMVATRDHQNLMEDFIAVFVLERFGVDPRKANREAHSANVYKVIASGRQLLGYEKEKPVFIAELVDLNDSIMELQNIWVPMALRSRKRLIGGALAQATQLAVAKGKEVTMMANNTAMHDAAKRGGFEQRAAFRYVAMVGH